MAPSLMARDSNAHTNGVDQIVTDQAGSDCDRKLSSGRAGQPMLIAGSRVMDGVPPPIGKTGSDCHHYYKGEPAAWSVEESFRLAFPSGQYQTEQAEKASNGHTNQGKSQSWS